MHDSVHSSVLWRIVEGGAFAALYVALDWLSYLQPLESAGITPWNPPAGLSLAFLLRRGWLWAPLVAAAAALSDLSVRGSTTTLAHALASSAWLGASYGALTFWIGRRCGAGLDFRRVSEASWFAGVVCAAELVVGVGFLASLNLLGTPPRPPLAHQLLQFWVGDVIGILVFTPALLCVRFQRSALRPLRAEWMAQAAAVAGSLWLLWGFDSDFAPRLFYVLFIPLVWIGVRHGVAGASVALVAIQLGLIAGLFLAGRKEHMALELQLLMLTLALTGLLLGASISEQKLTERALRERQADLDNTLRLAAASETASALAHELNQPLTAIASYVGASRLLLARDPADRARLESALAAAARESARAGEIVRRLREFFRSGAKRLERVAVEQLLLETTQAMQPALERHRVALRIHCDDDAGEVNVDRVQIESVVHQLVENAVEAMTGAGSWPRLIAIDAACSGAAVSIEVRDSGPGVDPELGESIFSPFKTTKALGTGLGLSISRTIVENHGGKLTFVPSPTGARFVLTLPAAP